MAFNHKLIPSYSLAVITLVGCSSGASTASTAPLPCNPCTIYSATNQSNGFNGNIESQAAALLHTTFSNGISAADALCNSDESKPAYLSGAKYKALLVDGINRGWNPNINWVIYSQTTYINTRGETIGVSTESAILNFPTTNSMIINNQFAWTGLGGTTLWETATTNCNAWSSSDSSIYGNSGYEDYQNPLYESSSYQLYQGNTTCNQQQLVNLPIGLLCVQQ